MALDPKKLRALAPLLPDDNYRSRKQRLLTIAIGALVVAIGLVAVIGSGAFTQHSDSARMLIAFVLLCWATLFGFSLFFLFTFWYGGQWVARRAHAYAAELDGRTT